MKKGVKKALKISAIALVALLATVLISVIVIVLIEPLQYGDYYADAKAEFSLPGLNDGFVQQGITYADGDFLSSGYMGNGKPSRIYVTFYDDNDEAHADKEDYWVSLKNKNGGDYFGHAGGISAYGEFVYLCDSEGSQMLVYSLSDILGSDKEGAVTAIGAFSVHSNASFCYVGGDILYVGEFYREGDYPTDEKHHMTTAAGDRHHSLVFGYELSPSAENGLLSGVPVLAYSVADLAQGMCVTASGRIVISTSYALANSHHLVYSKPDAAKPDSSFSVSGADVPLWELDSSSLEKDIVCPPMSEGLVYVSGRVFWIGESASNKYFFGKLFRAVNVWSYPLA